MSPALLAKLPQSWTAPRPDAHWHRQPRLRESLAHCQGVARAHAKSFYFSALPLPDHKKAAAFAIYAFCRYVDDLIDESREADGSFSPAGEGAFLERLNGELAALEREASPLPFAPAFAEASRQFSIERQFYLDLITGCCLDEKPARVATFAELEVYCYHVASVVGLMMSKIYGLRSAEGVHRAVEMGIAMQLTNILRDVREDHAAGRVYLPLDELAAAGFSADDLGRAPRCSRWKEFLRGQIERARRYYRSAEPGIELLENDGSRRATRLMSSIYAGILREIEAADYDVFVRRHYVPAWKKVVIAARVWR